MKRRGVRETAGRAGACACKPERAGAFGLSLGQDSQSLLAHQIPVLLGLRLVLLCDIIPASRRGVILAVRRKTVGDSDTGAIELADDPLLLFLRRAFRGCEDEVRGPP